MNTKILLKKYLSWRYMALVLVVCLLVQVLQIPTVFAVGDDSEKVTASFTSVLEDNQATEASQGTDESHSTGSSQTAGDSQSAARHLLT